MLKLAPGLSLPEDVLTEALAITGTRGSGKALALDTPIPTPDGWTAMGDLVEGDTVFDETGSPCRVVAAHATQYNRRCYRVLFSDGSQVVADGEHLWLTSDIPSRSAANRKRRGRLVAEPLRTPQIRTTEQIASTLRVGPRGDLNHAVALAAALDLPHVDLPIDPYVFGAWLGDGTSTTAVVTSADPEIIENIVARGYTQGGVYAYETGRCPQYRIGAGPDGVKLNTALRLLGVMGNKHIPQEYLRASRTQRLDLLRGLMDTDGWQQGNSMIGLTNERLADGVHELVVSLGWKATRSKKQAKLNGVEHGISHIISFRPDECPFFLGRKVDTWQPRGAQASRHEHRMIVAVEPMESVPVRCIEVDSASHLFLAGRDMVPTHNTYTSKKLVELMTDLGLPTCVIDPLGVWWGLRSSADGKKPGLPFVVLGGKHHDVPLEPTAGKDVAQWLLENRVPVILDLSLMRKAEQRRFVAAFLEEIYERNTDPLHLVVDECDLFCPQRPSRDFPMTLLGTMEDIVRRGRSKGLGISLISQRPAVIHKDVLTQVAVLIAMRLVSPQDRKAIHDWIETHGTPEERKLILDALPGLEPGDGFFYSPSFMGVLQRFKAYRAKTFDSSATPKLGERRIEPTAFAPVDLDVLSERMAESIERAKENDPKLLRGEVAKLKRRIADLDAELDLRVQREHEFEPTVVERIVPARLDQRFTLAVEGLRSILDEVHTKLDEGYEGLAELEKLIEEANGREDGEEELPARTLPPYKPTLVPAPAPAPARPLRPVQGGADLNKVEREILTVLAQFPDGRTLSQLAILTGRSSKSSGFKNALSSLRTSGALLGSNKDVMRPTESGLERLSTWDPLPTGRALVDHWMANLGKPERAILETLVAAWPMGLYMTQIATQANYATSSSGFKNGLSKLRTLGLLEGGNREIMHVSEIFFDNGDWR